MKPLVCFVFRRLFVRYRCQLWLAGLVIGDAPLVDPHSLTGGVIVFIRQSPTLGLQINDKAD